MTDEKPKREPPLFLDMTFEEALARFGQTRLDETVELEQRTSHKRKTARGRRAAPPSKSGKERPVTKARTQSETSD